MGGKVPPIPDPDARENKDPGQGEQGKPHDGVLTAGHNNGCGQNGCNAKNPQKCYVVARAIRRLSVQAAEGCERPLVESRLDELPQLLNVLVGDMSLIGPRPLLPKDQPADPTTRLTVRPGITGWAQIKGGTLLTSEEKHQLDEWYIRNASL